MPKSSVTIHCILTPLVFASVIEPAGILSGTPSLTESKANGPPNKSPPFALQPLALLRITSIKLTDRLTHPVRSAMFKPWAKPPISPSYATFHIWHTPAPGASKFTALGIGGKPKIYPSSSVTTHCILAPLVLASVIEPTGILSATPSPTELNVNGPPKRSPPFASQPLALLLITSTGLADKL